MVHEVIDKLVAKNLVNNEDLLTLLAPEKGRALAPKILFELQRGIQERFQIKQSLMIPTIANTSSRSLFKKV